ncbi:Polyadenylate-binding protein 8 [Forsythia ovata]|uniref:Polyadenylate-binding protein 8 n=1 Tax=Forsythia ovata TaxID=205694 RepID=A0ABD1W629_9LAMI
MSLMLPRGRMYQYPLSRNLQEVSLPGVAGEILSAPYDVGGILSRDAAIPQPMPITTLASALANAIPEQQRTMLGENLYHLVDQLEHEHAAKVIGHAFGDGPNRGFTLT